MTDIKLSPLSFSIRVVLMVAITMILAAVIASFVYGMSQNIGNPPGYVTSNETFTIIEKVWDGVESHFGYVTVSDGSAYRVSDGIEYMRLQVNHTYNVEMDLDTWRFPVITKVNYEVQP